MNDLRLIDIKEPWLRELILEKSHPDHFVGMYKLTQEQILQYLETMYERGLAWFLGSESERFVYRVAQLNPYVIEPHYIGNMRRLRTIQPLAMKWVFDNTQIQKINVFTSLRSSYHIQQKHGFKIEGELRKTFFEDGELKDLHILGLTREDFYEYWKVRHASTAGSQSLHVDGKQGG